MSYDIDLSNYICSMIMCKSSYMYSFDPKFLKDSLITGVTLHILLKWQHSMMGRNIKLVLRIILYINVVGSCMMNILFYILIHYNFLV